MKHIHLKLWDKIEIDWIDSVRSTLGWRDRRDFPWDIHYDAMHIKTIGYYMNMTKNALSITQAYVYKRESEDNIGVFSIPIGCIKKIRRLK